MCIFALVALLTLSATRGVRSAEQKQLTIYSPEKTFSVALAEHERAEYVDLVVALGPLGKLDVRQDGRKWKLRLNGEEIQFVQGKNKGKVRGHDFVMAQRFLGDQGRALIPLASLPLLLHSLLRVPVRFHAAGRRLFLGNAVNPFNVQFVGSTPPQLVLNFATPVSPVIANEPGKMHITFTRDPVIDTGPNLSVQNSAISGATYEERNGQAEVTITASAPLLANFSNDGKTLTVVPAPPVTAAKNPLSSPGATPAPPPSTASVPAATPPRPPQRRFLVVVDPSHGGDERGAALSDTLAEKDVTLALGRMLRHELQARGIDVLLLRDADTTLSTDQRAAAANNNRAALFLTLHAGSVGQGVRLYTSLIPAETQGARGNFIPWDLAQASFLNTSRSLAATLASEIQSRQIGVRVLFASLPPLNHVAAPAIGVEVAPRAGEVNDLTSPTYQQAVASALAAGVAAIHDRMEATR